MQLSIPSNSSDNSKEGKSVKRNNFVEEEAKSEGSNRIIADDSDENLDGQIIDLDSDSSGETPKPKKKKKVYKETMDVIGESESENEENEDDKVVDDDQSDESSYSLDVNK